MKEKRAWVHTSEPTTTEFRIENRFATPVNFSIKAMKSLQVGSEEPQNFVSCIF